MGMVDWDAVRIPKELVKQIDKFLKSELAKRNGYNSRSQFVIDAVREYLKRYEAELSKPRPRLQHINVYRNRVTILDNELEGRGRIVDVVFMRKNHQEEIIYPYCTYCQTSDCIHADYAFEIPKVREILEKAGIKKRVRGETIEDIASG